MKKGKWIGLALLGAVVSPAGSAGEFQFTAGYGYSDIRIDADRMRDGEAVNSGGMAARGTVGYRTDPGLLVELGITGYLSIDSNLVSGALQKSLGVGWQFENTQWRFTPKVGLLHSYLDAAGGRRLLEDGRPTERFKDFVPFIEAVAEHRFGRRFGLGLFLRHVFEDFGESQAYGVSFRWNTD